MQQHRTMELMDDPALQTDEHFHALRGLDRINRLSMVKSCLWRPLATLQKELRRPISVLDVATGSGQWPIDLYFIAKEHGVELTIAGCDISPRAIERASQRAGDLGARVTFSVHDVLAAPLPKYDVVTCSLFLHHLDRTNAAELLRRMKAAANALILIEDLQRSVPGMILAWVVPPLISTSRVVRVDARRSVRAAYTAHEALQLGHEAGLAGATVRRHWPCRYLLQWRRADGDTR